VGAGLAPERRRDARHPLVADRADLDGFTVGHHRQQRDGPLLGEVDVLHRAALLVQDVLRPQADGVQIRAEPLVLGARQRGQQPVRRTLGCLGGRMV
jgi:hypothetical protein